MFSSETELIARYGETDQMSIVHHSNYPIWFEAGRTEFFKKLGIRYSKIEEKGIILPLVDLKCNFKDPVKYEDEIIIRTKPMKMSCVRLIFSYEVIKKDKMSLVAVGETSHAWTDKSLKPINIEKRMPELCMLLKEVIKIIKEDI